jgi:hypothetical protein
MAQVKIGNFTKIPQTQATSVPNGIAETVLFRAVFDKA